MEKKEVPEDITQMGAVGNTSDACFEVNSSDAPSVYFRSVEGIEMPERVLTKIIWTGPKMTILEHWMSKGQVLPFHRHNVEFINFLVSGRVKATLAGREYTAGAWDSWTAVPGVEHSVEALEYSVVMEFFAPPGIIQNEFFLTWGSAKPATTHYFTRESEIEGIPVPLVEGSDEKVGASAIEPKLLVPGPNVCMNIAHCRPGKRAWHAHWHTWVTYMAKGGFNVWMGGKYFKAPAGHYWGAAPGVEHANMSPGDSYALEFKLPVPQVWLGRIKSWEAPVE